MTNIKITNKLNGFFIESIDEIVEGIEIVNTTYDDSLLNKNEYVMESFDEIKNKELAKVIKNLKKRDRRGY